RVVEGALELAQAGRGVFGNVELTDLDGVEAELGLDLGGKLQQGDRRLALPPGDQRLLAVRSAPGEANRAEQLAQAVARDANLVLHAVYSPCHSTLRPA